MTLLTRKSSRALPVRLALPRLDIPALVLVLAPLAALTVAIVQPVDFDYFWHRRTGEYMLQAGVFPRSDPFAFTTAGKAWVDHEWLSQIVMFGIDSAFGYIGVFLAFFGLGVAGWWLIYRLLRAERLGRAQAALLSLAPLVFGAMHWRARPSMFTVFFLALLLHELFAARRGERRSLWHLAVIMPIWANLHGGYVIGLVVMGVFVGAQWLDRASKPRVSWRHAALVAAVGFALTGLNPYTWQIWTYPFTYFAGENASLRAIDEWQSPNFHEIRNAPLAILLLLTMLIGANGRRFDAWRSSLMVIFGLMVLQSMRHQPLFALVWAPVVGVSLVERWSWWSKPDVSTGGIVSFNWALLAGSAAALFTVVAVSPNGVPLREPPAGGAMPFPEQGAAYIQQELPGARVFNDYAWGGFLIDRLHPEARVFIDGRADLHGSLVTEYNAVVRGDGWEESFERYGVTAALIPPDFPLAEELRVAGWRTGYYDRYQVVLIAPEP